MWVLHSDEWGYLARVPTAPAGVAGTPAKWTHNDDITQAHVFALPFDAQEVARQFWPSLFKDARIRVEGVPAEPAPKPPRFKGFKRIKLS